MRQTKCSTFTTAIFAGVILFSGVSLPASDGCLLWTDSTYGYSICLPHGWYKRTMPSGALFLCDDQRGRCTTAVGGGPSLGHATVSLLPSEVVLTQVPATLEEFAHQVADKDASSAFSEVVSVDGRFAPMRYLAVEQTFNSGGRNESQERIYRYFVQADRTPMVELILAFNDGDKRSAMYREAALKGMPGRS